MKSVDIDPLDLHSTLQSQRGPPKHPVGVFVRSQPSRTLDSYRATAWCVDTQDDEAPRQLTSRQSNARSLQLSSDGKTLAFLTRRQGKPGTQIQLLPMSGGEAQRLTSLQCTRENIDDWSADGTSLLATAGKRTRLFRIDVASGEATQITFGAPAS